MKRKNKELATILKNRGKTNILRETFGTIKFKKSVRKMMKEMDRDLYDM